MTDSRGASVRIVAVRTIDTDPEAQAAGVRLQAVRIEGADPDFRAAFVGMQVVVQLPAAATRNHSQSALLLG